MDSDIYAEKIRFNFRGNEKTTSIVGVSISALVNTVFTAFLFLCILSFFADQTEVINFA
jgi:hypothetical protein